MKAEESVIIMAHRPAAIEECDTLLVLENGTRVAFGPDKDEVMRAVGKITPRFETQFSSKVGKDGGVVAEILVDKGTHCSRIAERDNLDYPFGPKRLIFEIAHNLSPLIPIDELKSGQEQLFHARRASLTKQVEQLRKRTAQIDNQIDGIIAQKAALLELKSFPQTPLWMKPRAPPITVLKSY